MCPSFFGEFFVLIIHSTHAVITMPSPQRIMFFFHILNFCFFTISGRSCSAHPASLPGSGAKGVSKDPGDPEDHLEHAQDAHPREESE